MKPVAFIIYRRLAWATGQLSPNLDCIHQKVNVKFMTQFPFPQGSGDNDEGETIGMTTNADTVKNYKAVDDVVNGGAKNGAGVELRKRKESLAKRQQSFIRQDSCGVVLERPLTR